MALDFNGSGRNVNLGTFGSASLPTELTVLAWVYPSSFAATGTGNTFFNRVEGSWIGFQFASNEEHGKCINIYAVRNSSWSNMCEAVSVADVLSTGKWFFVGGQLKSTGNDTDQKLFVGDLSTPAGEPSYTKQVVSTGTWPSLSSRAYYIGNHQMSTNTLYHRGPIAWFGFWNRILSLGEIWAQQFRPHVTSGCLWFGHLGANGTGTQANWAGSGNNGTVTGATVADHVPIRPWFGSDMYLHRPGISSLPTLGINVSPDNSAYYRRGVKIIGG